MLLPTAIMTAWSAGLEVKGFSVNISWPEHFAFSLCTGAHCQTTWEWEVSVKEQWNFS